MFDKTTPETHLGSADSISICRLICVLISSYMVSNAMTVITSKQLRKKLSNQKFIPYHIKQKYDQWVKAVKTEGIPKSNGCNNKKLSTGDVSVRLSKAYRIRYRFVNENEIEVTNVDNHYK